MVFAQAVCESNKTTYNELREMLADATGLDAADVSPHTPPYPRDGHGKSFFA